MTLKETRFFVLLLLSTYVHLGVTQQSSTLPCTCPAPILGNAGTCTSRLPNFVCENATRVRLGSCGVADQCYVLEKCLHADSCTYSWTGWSAFGSCDNRCTTRRIRVCLRQSTTTGDRCAGAIGTSIQHESQTCVGGACITTSSVLRTTTARTTTPTNSEPSKSTSVISTSQQLTPTSTFPTAVPIPSPTNASNGTSASRNQTENTSAPPLLPPAAALSSDIILLIAILGAAFMLSIAIVAVAYMILRKRKKSSDGSLLLTQRPLPLSVANTTYEVVGPPQRSPPSTPNRSAPNNQSGGGRMVENRLYEMTHLENQNSFGQNGRVEMPTNSDGYLRPISPPNAEESVYAQPARPANAGDVE